MNDGMEIDARSDKTVVFVGAWLELCIEVGKCSAPVVFVGAWLEAFCLFEDVTSLKDAQPLV